MNVAPSERTCSYSLNVASRRCVQSASAHSQMKCVLDASKRSALSAMRSLTSRKRASVRARFTLSSIRRLPSTLCDFENGEEATTVSPMAAWPESVERVASVLRERGVQARLEEFEHGTGSARDAAKAVGCELEQIVKSLVFICDG